MDDLLRRALSLELRKYTLPIVIGHELFPTGDVGSGVRITIGGRLLVATAGHNLVDKNGRDLSCEDIFLVSEQAKDSCPRIIGKGRRGGASNDLGWLEIAPRALGEFHWDFLPLERTLVRAGLHSETAFILGSPVAYRERETDIGEKPAFTHRGYFTSANPVKDDRDIIEPDRERRLYLEWPRIVECTDGESRTQPDAPGLSGCGIWLSNYRPDRANWSPRDAVLIGIENAWVKSGVPQRYVVGYQIQEWLKMVAEDIPELSNQISDHLNAINLRAVLGKNC